MKQTFIYAAQVNRWVIIEKCEVKEGRGPSNAKSKKVWGHHILENYFAYGQHNILVFQPIYFTIWTQEGSISGPSVFYKIAAIFI